MFSALYSVFPFYFMCFVKAAPEPVLITSITSVVNPITDSLGIPKDLTDLLSCLIVEIFIAYVSVLCAFGILVENPLTFLACLIDKLAGQLGALFTATLNALVLSIRELKKTGCEAPLTYYNQFVVKKCPAFTLLNRVLLQLAGIGSSPQTKEHCGSEGFSLPTCLLLQIFIIHLQVICGLVGIGRSGLETATAVAAKWFTQPWNGVLDETFGKVYIGLVISSDICQNVTSSWTNDLNGLCPGFLTGVNTIVASIFDLLDPSILLY